VALVRDAPHKPFRSNVLLNCEHNISLCVCDKCAELTSEVFLRAGASAPWPVFKQLKGGIKAGIFRPV
jgi:hypothetical protein